MDINMIALIVLVTILVVYLTFVAYLYFRDKSLEDIRADVYQLFLKAEHTYTETGAGKKKMKYVISRARALLPSWLNIFLTDAVFEKIIEMWFRSVKDLLDDGRINKSAKKKK